MHCICGGPELTPEKDVCPTNAAEMSKELGQGYSSRDLLWLGSVPFAPVSQNKNGQRTGAQMKYCQRTDRIAVSPVLNLHLPFVSGGGVLGSLTLQVNGMWYPQDQIHCCGISTFFLSGTREIQNSEGTHHLGAQHVGSHKTLS